MGCGAVETSQNMSKHFNYSQQTLQTLLPKIKVNNPLLEESHYEHFACSLRQSEPAYILALPSSVPEEEAVPVSILQKWRIVLYGLEKEDYTYRRCLGFEFRNENQLTNRQQPSNNITDNPSYHELKNKTQYHSCFQQIEKDLNRTFSFQTHTQLLFEKVLKRIANHFPSMGYTQGVNFVVGYLLLMGYSEADTFWMFAHLAMNKNYLLLGLYEDGFPLANIYTLIFKNILKRVDPTLFNHLYSNLMLDESVWIFKWFITYYIYSFPLEIIKYVWDVVIELGGLGLVYFAIALVTHLRLFFLKSEDSCDISQFLQSLKQLSTFNQLVKIKEVIQSVYEIKLTKEDLNGIECNKPNFYQQYFKLLQNQLESSQNSKSRRNIKAAIPKWKLKQDQPTQCLHLWYVKLLEERMTFTTKTDQQKKTKEQIPEQLKEDYQEMQKSIKWLQEKVQLHESQQTLKSISELPPETQQYFHQLATEEGTRGITEQINMTATIEELQADKSKHANKISYDIGEEINELEGESDSNNGEQLEPSAQYISPSTSRTYVYEPPEPSIRLYGQDQPHRHQLNTHLKKININDMAKIDHTKKKSNNEQFSKANNLPITASPRSGFGLAGQTILNNISATNSQYSSIQSKNNNSYKPKKQKQNNLSRYNSTASKHKIEALSQLSHPSNELSSEQEESLDRRTEKDSLSGLTQRDNPKKERPSYGRDENYLERKTQQELMAVSHGPDKLANRKATQNQQPVSQIELFNGEGLFKKKKRNFNRNSIVTSITHAMTSNPHEDSTSDIKPPQLKLRTYNEEESLQSVLQLSTARKRVNKKGGTLDNAIFEIESIK